VLGVPDAVLAFELTGHLLGEIVVRGFRDGPRLAGDAAVKTYLKDGRLTVDQIRYRICLATDRGYLGPGRQGTRRRTPGPRLAPGRSRT
jgi:hypothetical protein